MGFKLNCTKYFIPQLLAIVVASYFGVWANASAQNEYHYIVKLTDASSAPQLARWGSGVSERFRFTENPEFRNIYTFDSVLTLSEITQKLSGEFAYLQVNSEFELKSIVTNDPGFTGDGQDVDKEWGLVKSAFPTGWEKTTGSTDTVVAVIDTGLDATHEDLQNIGLVDGYNFITEQPITGRINSDDNGHGTLVAGVLGATPNNGVGIVGTNWNVSIMPLKALDAAGKGDSVGISEALVFAADHGAAVVNLSLGGIGFGRDATLANSIAYAFNKGAVVVAAAGNDVSTTGGDLDNEPVYPICDDNNENMVIGVSATDQNDLKAGFSNYGKNCIDVSAPGKRILSTINYDPFNKKPAPNSYAFASGTSLAVPFVSGQAALLKALFPKATNKQIRDRIIATTDSIDFLNLTQCGGSSCIGELGSGRINVARSLDWNFTQQGVSDGDVVRVAETGITYLISGGQKRLISTFVFNQKYSQVAVKTVSLNDLTGFPDGVYATPIDGTLVKMDSDPSVYMISKGQKLPITYQVFIQRGFKFLDVNTVSFSEINSWVTGNLLSPPDGNLLRGVKNKTVYWVVGGVLHPINRGFYLDKGLNIFPVLTVADSELTSYSKGEAYIR